MQTPHLVKVPLDDWSSVYFKEYNPLTGKIWYQIRDQEGKPLHAFQKTTIINLNYNTVQVGELQLETKIIDKVIGTLYKQEVLEKV